MVNTQIWKGLRSLWSRRRKPSLSLTQYLMPSSLNRVHSISGKSEHLLQLCLHTQPCHCVKCGSCRQGLVHCQNSNCWLTPAWITMHRLAQQCTAAAVKKPCHMLDAAYQMLCSGSLFAETVSAACSSTFASRWQYGSQRHILPLSQLILGYTAAEGVVALSPILMDWKDPPCRH